MKISSTKICIIMLQCGINSAKELAERSGVSVNTLSRIKNGAGARLALIRLSS